MTTKNNRKKKTFRKRYLIETNRAMRDSIRAAARILEKHGLSVRWIAHLTRIIVERPVTMSWDAFKDAVRAIIQPRIGSAVIASCTTGRVFLCDNRGNQPGRFQRIDNL